MLGERGAAAPNAADEAREKLYGPSTTLQELFGDLSGRLLQDQLFRLYQIGDPCTVPLFNAKSERMIYRHPLNMRNHKVAFMFDETHGLVKVALGIFGAMLIMLGTKGRLAAGGYLQPMQCIGLTRVAALRLHRTQVASISKLVLFW
jgi:hypothetical protein